jgi:dipeptidyl aminopeptidase/acylaminoacyl peptidase
MSGDRLAQQDRGWPTGRSNPRQMRTFAGLGIMLAVGWLIPLSARANPSDQKRVLTLDDFPDHPVYTQMDDAGWSPDGSRFAYLVYGQKRTVRTDENGTDSDGSDIWVLDARKGRSSRITDGNPDSSYSGAQWSPDGRQVAFVARKSGDVWLMVWNADTEKVRRVSPRTLNVGYFGQTVFAWLSKDRLLAALGGTGEVNSTVPVPLQAIHDWRNAWQSTSGEVSVLDVDPQGQKHRVGLVSLDLASGSSKTIWTGNTTGITLSPDRRYVAIYASVDDSAIPVAKRLMSIAEGPGGPSHLVVLDVRGQKMAMDYTASFDDGTGELLPLAWSADGRKLAFCTRGLGEFDAPIRLYVANLESSTSPAVQTTLLPEARARGLAPFIRLLDWSTPRLLALLGASYNGAAVEIKGNAGWVVANSAVGLEQIRTEGASDVPTRWILGPNRTELIGLAGGSLWKLEGDSDETVPYIVPDLRSIDRMLPQSDGLDEAKPERSVIVHAKDLRGSEGWYRIDLSNGKTYRLRLPNDGAQVISVDAAVGSAILSKENYRETRAWLFTVATQRLDSFLLLRKVPGTNPDDIALGGERRIRYRDSAGQMLGADLTLPSNYIKGRRYPMVVVVYPGQLYQAPDLDDSCFLCETQATTERTLGDLDIYNWQILASRGYLVLIPSMPLPQRKGSTSPSLSRDEPGDHLLDGVMPAIDKAIELGYADPDRLAIMGHSYGGFATYSILTQTTRFKAAVSLAGISDFVSFYGVFIPSGRYSDDPLDLFQMSWTEFGQAGLGTPPWSNPEVYVRNSPLFNVEKIGTPLMIVQGDMDSVPIEQGEEMFSAMLRLNKKCRFVRYWTQGHEVQRPSQVKDMWRRMIAWLDENLDADTSKGKGN